MYCKNCGKEISDNAFVCPYCGVKAATAPTEKKTNTLAIVGFILSLFFPLIGLICCVIARKQIKQNNESGMGFATAGLVISLIWIIGGILSSIISILIWVGVIGGIGAALSMLPIVVL